MVVFSNPSGTPTKGERGDSLSSSSLFVLVPSSAKAGVGTFESAGCRPGRLGLVMVVKPNLKDDGWYPST